MIWWLKAKSKGAMRLKIMLQFYSLANMFQAAMKMKLQMKSAKFQISMSVLKLSVSFLKLCDLGPAA